MSCRQTILGPILNPRPDGSVAFVPDGALCCDDNGVINYIGSRETCPPSLAPSRKSQGIILPPFLDAHIHIPQHPIRGHFMDGIGENPENGRLLAGLNRNVFPAEARCANATVVEAVVREFASDTLAHGVVGGAAYMTVHPAATDIALSRLNPFWSVGLVLMEMNCPEYLRTDPALINDEWARDLAHRFGKRFIMTDRFAVSVGSNLRRWASTTAARLDLRTQTHLNEQLREKEFVEKTLYPDRESYTDVYYRDGLLDHRAILAHCIHMTPAEFDLVAQTRSVIAHCPTSNTLLSSGIMPLDKIHARQIPYALCTDVGASPTTSILSEMSQFLKVHEGRSKSATPSEALYRATLAPAKMLDLDDQIGSFEVGKPLSFIEVDAGQRTFAAADEAILHGLLDFEPAPENKSALDHLATGRLDAGPELNVLEQDARQTARRLDKKVIGVTLAGMKVFDRNEKGV